MRGVNKITVRVPIVFKRRRGRKRVVAEDRTEFGSVSPSETNCAAKGDSTSASLAAHAVAWRARDNPGAGGGRADQSVVCQPDYVANRVGAITCGGGPQLAGSRMLSR